MKGQPRSLTKYSPQRSAPRASGPSGAPARRSGTPRGSRFATRYAFISTYQWFQRPTPLEPFSTPTAPRPAPQRRPARQRRRRARDLRLRGEGRTFELLYTSMYRVPMRSCGAPAVSGRGRAGGRRARSGRRGERGGTRSFLRASKASASSSRATNASPFCRPSRPWHTATPPAGTRRSPKKVRTSCPAPARQAARSGAARPARSRGRAGGGNPARGMHLLGHAEGQPAHLDDPRAARVLLRRCHHRPARHHRRELLLRARQHFHIPAPPRPPALSRRPPPARGCAARRAHLLSIRSRSRRNARRAWSTQAMHAKPSPVGRPCTFDTCRGRARGGGAVSARLGEAARADAARARVPTPGGAARRARAPQPAA